MIYPFNRLLEFDLNNQQSIKIDDIVDSIIAMEKNENYERNKNSILSKLDHRRFTKVSKKLISYFELKIKETKKNYFSLDSININNYIFNESKKNELFPDEIELICNLIIELNKEVEFMCLSLNETNSQLTKKEQFHNAQADLIIALRNMGRIEESNFILNIDYSKIYSFSSYTKNWIKKKKEILILDEKIRKDKIKKILSIVIYEVREKLLIKEKVIDENIFNLKVDKKYYKRLKLLHQIYSEFQG